jgi:flagellin
MEKVWVVSDEVEGTASTFTSNIDTNMSDDNRYWSGAYDTDHYGTNVLTVNRAREAVTHLDDAIDEINRERSYIGSEQNKLQFTMSNLTSTINSVETARSHIEDVDYASEMSELTKNQILVQSSTAMLAQANMVSQNILQLLGN